MYNTSYFWELYAVMRILFLLLKFVSKNGGFVTWREIRREVKHGFHSWTGRRKKVTKYRVCVCVYDQGIIIIIIILYVFYIDTKQVTKQQKIVSKYIAVRSCFHVVSFFIHRGFLNINITRTFALLCYTILCNIYSLS